MSKSYDGIMGLAMADAMGVPVEFCDRSELKNHPIIDVEEFGTYNQPAGFWSDDTSLTLATMDGIIRSSGMINEGTYQAIADNFVAYYKAGAFTPDNKLFDIGNTTRNAIKKYATGNYLPYYCGGVGQNNTGNGALMRILPVAYYAHQNNLSLASTFDITRKVSSLTHRLDTCVLGSFIYVEFARKLLEDSSKYEAYSYIQSLNYSKYLPRETVDEYSRILNGNIWELDEKDISSKGKTLPTLESSLWSFMRHDNYADSILEAINLGDDTDTVGAVTGGLAGIYYGGWSIPKEWLNKLARKTYLQGLCNSYDESIKNKSIPMEYALKLKQSGNPNFFINRKKSIDIDFYRD